MALLIGLTGGVATGKSTVARLFAELGARVIDADQVAREVVSLGSEGLAEIVGEFGPEVLQPDGSLDRARLRAIVFDAPEKRLRLEAITHPRIAAEIARRIQSYLEKGDAPIVIEAALLLETKTHIPFDHLVVVTAPPGVQLRRLEKRDGTAPADGRKILAAQMPTSEKIARADVVIDNGGSLEETRRQVRAVWQRWTRGEARPVEPGKGL